MISISPRQQVNWDWRAAGNFVFGGTGTGLMAMIACVLLFGGRYVPDAVLASMVFVGAGLFLVFLEIGRPMRFLNVFRHPQTSWMSREAIAAMLFFMAGAFGWLLDNAPLIYAAAAFGLVFLLCQAKMLEASRGIPAWREPTIVPLVIITGLTEGAALLVLIALLRNAALPNWLSLGLLGLVVLRTVFLLAYAGRLRGPKSPNVVKPGLTRIVWMSAGLGGLIPFLMLAADLQFMHNAALLPIAAAIVLVTGWFLKYMIVCRLGAMQGFAVLHTPSRGGAAPGTSTKPGWPG